MDDNRTADQKLLAEFIQHVEGSLYRMIERAMENAAAANKPPIKFLVYHPADTEMLGGQEMITYTCGEFGLEARPTEACWPGKVMFLADIVPGLVETKPDGWRGVCEILYPHVNWRMQ